MYKDLSEEKKHVSVLAKEVLQYLSPQKNDVIVDATLGLGGHSSLIIEEIGKKGRLIVFDQDKENLEKAKENLTNFLDQITFFHTNFENLAQKLDEINVKEVDGALFDLGVASTHFDQAERGFSFSKEGYLDMRMDRSNGITVEEIINSFIESNIADIIYEYGEERKSRVIAKAIVEARQLTPIKTTTQLADIIEKVIRGKSRIHPATKTFQALRIYVNRELEVLEKGLSQAFDRLNKGGRLVVISFHSLEDRIVKKMFKKWAAKCVCGPDVWKCECGKVVEAEILTKRPIVPGRDEMNSNPRARSAKMRALKKI